MTLSQTLDCRGLQCPEPILRIAKAARQTPSPGRLFVQADDVAFPLDLKSWCKSAGAELVRLDETGSGYAAEVRLARAGGIAPVTRAAAEPATIRAAGAPAVPAEVLLDCRGKQCPEPILELARAARTATSRLRIVADDAAFELDLKAWCKTSGATLESFELRDAIATAIVLPKGARAAQPAPPAPPPASTPSTPRAVVVDAATSVAIDVDFSAVTDPATIAARASTIAASGPGLTARFLVADQACAQAVLELSATHGHTLRSMRGNAPVELILQFGERRAGGAELAVAPGAIVPVDEADADCALLVLHNDLEALLAAMLIANGAAAQGMRVVIFFTFWGLNLLRGDAPAANAPVEKVSFVQRVFKWMMPKGPRRQQLGQLNFGGAGPVLLKGLMKKQNLTDLPRLVQQAEEQGVRFVACTMSMSVMGITKRDLAPYSNLEFGGVSYFVGAARGAKMSLVF